MPVSLLLKGGVALVHDKHDHVRPTITDILIEGNRIVKIGPSIMADATTEVIDCANKIISPGFVDTHHHVWQTQLKGRHADDALLEYVPKGNVNIPCSSQPRFRY
jgi:cytosine/adenosine deaminase-related metal-dependent hydrolase